MLTLRPTTENVFAARLNEAVLPATGTLSARTRFVRLICRIASPWTSTTPPPCSRIRPLAMPATPPPTVRRPG